MKHIGIVLYFIGICIVYVIDSLIKDLQVNKIQIIFLSFGFFAVTAYTELSSQINVNNFKDTLNKGIIPWPIVYISFFHLFWFTYIFYLKSHRDVDIILDVCLNSSILTMILSILYVLLSKNNLTSSISFFLINSYAFLTGYLMLVEIPSLPFFYYYYQYWGVIQGCIYGIISGYIFGKLITWIGQEFL